MQLNQKKNQNKLYMVEVNHLSLYSHLGIHMQISTFLKDQLSIVLISIYMNDILYRISYLHLIKIKIPKEQSCLELFNVNSKVFPN